MRKKRSLAAYMPSSRPCEPLTFTVHPPNTKLFTFKVALQFGPGPKQKAKSMRVTKSCIMEVGDHTRLVCVTALQPCTPY